MGGRDPGDGVLGGIQIAGHSTDLEQLDLEELVGRVRALDESRRELIANVSHELKTPLSIILGLCTRVLDSHMANGATPDVERIRTNAYVLLRQVDELLQLARLESGRAVIEAVDVDVASVVDEVADGLRSVTEPRGQRLVVDAPRPLPARVDEDKLLSIVSNLLSNAVKFTPPAGLVRCTLASTGGGVHLEVADSGPGIPPAEREAVFERFHQVGGNGSARRAGTGLGLAIVRELVELHGGTIAVHDSPEGGASFVVDLPSQAVAPRRTAGSRLDVTERQRPALERLRSELAALDRRRTPRVSLPEPAGKAVVIIVTADAELGAFLEDVVAERYSFAHAIGIDQALRVACDDRPDVVLLDPAVLAEAPHADPIAELQRRLPGVAIVTLAADGDAAAAYLRAGADDCVLKPFSTHELLARLDKAAARLSTERRRHEIVTRLRSSFEHSPVGVCLIALDRQVMQANQALCDLLGYSREELLRKSVHDLTPPDGGLLLDWRIGTGAQRIRLMRADGLAVPGLVSVTVQRDEQGVPYFIAYVEDLAEDRSFGGHQRRLAAPRTRDARYSKGWRR